MKVKFEHSQEIAEHIRSFYFRPEKAVDYTAGQFIELTLPHPNPDERGVKHWFTLSSSPSEELLSITTKLARDRVSTFKQTLFALKPGDEVQMSDPMGDFVLPKDKTIPLVFVAGGIGVTPMRSMIKWLIDNHERRQITLIYAARELSEVAFRDLFDEYGLKPILLLDNPPADWHGETGRLSADKILQLTKGLANPLYYLSGPEPLVEQLNKDLADSGVSSSQLVGDYFPNYETV